MKKLNYEKLKSFIVSDVIRPFYEIRFKTLKTIRLKDVARRKNPYLFKAKNVETAGDLAKNILDAFLSSQEETVFGDLMENLAVNVCRRVFGGKKAEQAKYRSIDLIFQRDEKTYLVSIKSGPNWGNSDQINAMKRNFSIAKKILRIARRKKIEIIAVNGCIYGRDNQPYKADKKSIDRSYYKFCGQSFWELISGDDQLYKTIIQPLDAEAKKRDQTFKELYAEKINEMTKDIVELFCVKNRIDWDKIVEYVSKK